MEKLIYRDKLIALFKSYTGISVDIIEPVFGFSGSARKYFRLKGGDIKLIGTINNNYEENAAFIYLSKLFKSKNLPVPEIFATDKSQMIYLQQDLGNTSLFDIIIKEDATNHIDLLKKSLEYLLRFQTDIKDKINYNNCYINHPFNRDAALWDLNYFKYLFLRISGITVNEKSLDLDFFKIIDQIYDSDSSYGFMYRDFQSRNIMVENNRLSFIDYQGGMKGHPCYDVASLLYQTRIALNDDLREELAGYYFTKAKKYFNFNKKEYNNKLIGFALLRLLQNLGAYGYRGLFERKPIFIKPIIPAIHNSLSIIDKIPENWRPLYIKDLLLESLDHYDKRSGQEKKGLTVTINSFSYMQGVPTDSSGNGGGFVFDCRALPNPHHNESLRPYNGTEAVIKKWLEVQPAVNTFIELCKNIVMLSIENYIERGFKDLQVNFGCTGGKHRSVFCAEKFASMLKASNKKINVKVEHNNLF